MDEDLVSQQLYFLASCQMQWSNPRTEREGGGGNEKKQLARVGNVEGSRAEPCQRAKQRKLYYPN